MAVINLRGVPDNLAAQLKSEAALAGLGFHEYCVVILERRGHFGLTVARMLDGNENVVPRKKIADISVGGGATEGGGDPCLPRGGKAQIEEEMLREAFIYGRAGENPNAPGFQVSIPIQAHELQMKLRSAGLSTLAAELNARAEYLIPNVEPVGGWDICGTCGQVHTEGEYFNHNFVGRKNTVGIPVIERGKLIPAEDLVRYTKQAETDGNMAFMLYSAGVELDREILVRWGLAENYKPKTEEKGGAQGTGKTSKSGGNSGESGGSHPVSSDGDESPAVATGKPGVNMQALRDICAGKFKAAADSSVADDREWAKAKAERPDPYEVDLCGFKSYNEEDGEWYVCTKEKHGVKIKHGEWIKI